MLTGVRFKLPPPVELQRGPTGSGVNVEEVLVGRSHFSDAQRRFNPILANYKKMGRRLSEASDCWLFGHPVNTTGLIVAIWNQFALPIEQPPDQLDNLFFNSEELDFCHCCESPRKHPSDLVLPWLFLGPVTVLWRPAAPLSRSFPVVLGPGRGCPRNPKHGKKSRSPLLPLPPPK